MVLFPTTFCLELGKETDLDGKTIGIVGLGGIGARIAKTAHAFGMNVVAWSQNLARESAEKHGAHLVSKEELFRTVDIMRVVQVWRPPDRSRIDPDVLP
jgi:phosphoglycerate dehydrogenase-like enzyme